MFTFVLVIHLIIILLMIGLILLQKSESGGLVTTSSMGGLMSVRGSSNFLSRTTAILATAFFVTSITLVILSGGVRSKGGSLLDKEPLSQPTKIETPDVPVGAPLAQNANMSEQPQPATAIPETKAAPETQSNTTSVKQTPSPTNQKKQPTP